MRSNKIKMKKYLFIPALFILIVSSEVKGQNSKLMTGDAAPAFHATAYSGTSFDLKTLTDTGEVIIFFYRGSWCKFCNRQMNELSDSVKFLAGKGVTILAISPETHESMMKISENKSEEIIFISDSSRVIMDTYGVSFKPDSLTRKKYKLAGIDLEKANGNDENILPVPAVFVIGRGGILKFIYFNTDYKKRVSVNEILRHL